MKDYYKNQFVNQKQYVCNLQNMSIAKTPDVNVHIQLLLHFLFKKYLKGIKRIQY